MLTDTDVAKLRSFQNVVAKGDFNIKGEAVVPIGSLFQWFNSLGPVFDAIAKRTNAEMIKQEVGKITPPEIPHNVD